MLTAIAIPIFNSQLEKSRDATDQANIRSAYAELSAALISNLDAGGVGDDLNNGAFAWTTGTGTYTAAIAGKGTNTTWDNLPSGETFKVGQIEVDPVANFTSVKFTVNDENQITDIEPA